MTDGEIVIIGARCLTTAADVLKSRVEDDLTVHGRSRPGIQKTLLGLATPCDDLTDLRIAVLCFPYAGIEGSTHGARVIEVSLRNHFHRLDRTALPETEVLPEGLETMALSIAVDHCLYSLAVG